jgi:hypothetical protein
MKQILFSAIVLALFVTPVWTQTAASTASKALIAKQAAISKYENFHFGNFRPNPRKVSIRNFSLG